MNIKESISQLVGNTPLLELKNIQKELGLNAHVLAKLEYFNPAGSAKDRVALNMIENAEREGKLQKGSVIIEPTSGNTGIGLSLIHILAHNSNTGIYAVHLRYRNDFCVINGGN